jgi:hypothetical protein
LVINSDFRRKIFSLLVELYKKSKDVDSMNICRCLIFLDRAADISKFFNDLLKENKEVSFYQLELEIQIILKDTVLLVFQMGFELEKNATQQFRMLVLATLPEVSEASRMLTLVL